MTNVTFAGNVAGEIKLHYSPAGKAVAKFALASTPREKRGDQWVDGETTWVRVTVFGRDAENLAESLESGDRVLAMGRLKTEAWEDKNSGEKRTALVLLADEVAASVKFRQVKVARPDRDNPEPSKSRKPSKPVEDPWGSAGVNDDDEPPF